MNRYCIKIFYILMYRIHISLFSCNNKNVSKEINNENPIESNYVQLFFKKIIIKWKCYTQLNIIKMKLLNIRIITMGL